MKLSLGKKITFLLVAFAVVLSCTALLVSGKALERMNDEHFMARADEIAATAATVVDAQSVAKLHDAALSVYGGLDNHVGSDQWGSPEWEAYVGNYAHISQLTEFKTVMDELRALQAVNGVDCLYVSLVVPEDRFCMYLVDAALEDACPTGTLDPLYDVNARVIEDPMVGFPAYITNTAEYGWLVSAGAPVVWEGSVVGYAFADVSMDYIKQQQASYVVSLTVTLVGLTAVLCLAVALFVRRFISGPINTLSRAASEYCDPEERHFSFAQLDIHTRDEIEDLHRSMVQMEHDIDTYIDNLVETRAKLRDTREEADQMSALAHKDALTGMENKLAYDQEVLSLEREIAAGEAAFGIAVIDLNDLKVINDTYGHDCGNVSLTRLSQVIRTVFVHSPSFRIGGDEFAVVLRNNDYDKAHKLVQEFDSLIDQLHGSQGLRPWERISAALGYALYDAAQDVSVESVFRRADARMYERKKLMKGGTEAR